MVTDWNNATENGIAYTGSNAVNAPVSDWCYGWIVNIQPNHLAQFLFSNLNGNLYFRGKFGEVAGWGGWKRILTE
jgi:hypothetical protein